MNRHHPSAYVVACAALFLGLSSSRGDPPATAPAQTQPLTSGPDDSGPTRAAVARGLEWLATNQNPDGSFKQPVAAGTTAVPSLAVMAFVSAGHVPGRGQYGELLNKSIDFVLSSQQESGLFGHPGEGSVMYGHGISTLMLAKCFKLVDEERKAKITRALTRSVDLLVKAQLHDGRPKQMPYTGGWRYRPTAPDADISVTGWQILALHAASGCGIDVPKASLEAARDFIVRSASRDGGFGYQPGMQPNQVRSGIGIVTLEVLRGLSPAFAAPEHPRQALAAGDWLLANPPNNPNVMYYYYEVYNCSQALSQLGGKYAALIDGKGQAPSTHRGNLRDTLLAQQGKDGSFVPKAGLESEAGPACCTSLAILALCVPLNSP